jgi:hypothetical protein
MQMAKTAARCSCCGQTLKASPRPRQTAELETLDTSIMSPAEVIAYYKRRAPVDDCAFIVRIFPDLAALVPPRPTKADAFRLFDAARHRLTTPVVPDEAAFWRHAASRSKAWREGVPAESTRNSECEDCHADLKPSQVLASTRAHGRPLCTNCIGSAEAVAS